MVGLLNRLSLFLRMSLIMVPHQHSGALRVNVLRFLS